MSEVNGTNSPTGNRVINTARTGDQPPAVANTGMSKNPSIVSTPQKTPTVSAQPSANNPPTPSAQQPATVEKNQIKFHSSDLHQTKVATRENPFAEQNRQAAKRKEKQQKITKKSLTITGITLGAILIIGFLIWLIWWLFTFHIYEVDHGLEEWQQEANKVHQEAQEIYNTGSIGSDEPNNKPGSEDNVEAVNKFFDDKINATEDLSSKIDVVLMEIVFYDQNSRPDLVIRASEKISEYADQMSLTQLALYVPVIYNNYIALGNDEMADYWMNYAVEKGAIDGEDGAG